MTKRDEEMAKAIDIAVSADESEVIETYIRPRPVTDPAQVYSIRIPSSRLEQLRQAAAAGGAAPSALMREWVLDRLDAETSGRDERLLDDLMSTLEHGLDTARKVRAAHTKPAEPAA